MPRLALAVILLAVLLASDGVAEDRIPETSKPDVSSDKAAIDRDANGSFNELLSVAGQLEQAGRNEEAAKVRNEARNLALKSNLLTLKEAELESLQNEVDRIRKVTGNPQTVLIQLVGTNSDGNSSLSGTIVLLSDELPNQGEETELFVLLTAELASPPNSK